MKHYFSAISPVKTIAGKMSSISELVQEKILEFESQGSEEAFYVGDVGDIVNKLNRWKELLPRVEPFYAMKCNSDHIVVKTLADLGAGFDCASKGEISQVLKLGVNSDRIIYANPCKQKSFIKYAAKHAVDMMTFDNETELRKIKEIHPYAKLVLRILPTSDVKVQCQLGNKFGCHPRNVLKLLLKAQELDLDVMGISFHVGSGVGEAKAFAYAVEEAYTAWQTAVGLGFKMTLLDIGGGFPGQANAPVKFSEIATVVNEALDIYFPDGCGARIIAEPGRYMVASAFGLAVNIIAKRTVARDISDTDGGPDGHNKQNVNGNDEPSHMYYVNDGVYGSFNNIMFDHAHPEPEVFNDSPMTFTSSIWGPTCDGLDCIMHECKLPEMEVGQYIYFADMGAYTMAAGSTFNGMPRPKMFYVCSEELWEQVYPDPCTPKKRLESISKDMEFPIMKTGQDVLTMCEAVVNPIMCFNREEAIEA